MASAEPPNTPAGPMHPLRHAALRAYNTLSGPWRQRRLARLAQQGAAPMCVLFYHRVADKHPNAWTISCEEFQRHVDYCREHFELIGLDELQRRVERDVSPRPTVTFTFDDGYAENCHNALPLLIEYQVPTVYFVATAPVLEQRPFEHDVEAGVPLPVNTVEQLRWAANSGIEIGLHTRSHIDFARTQDPTRVRDEIAGAKEELEGMIGRQVRYLAVPFGMPAQLTQTVIETAAKAGLKGFCSAFGAYNLPGRDSFHIRRIHGDPEFARLRNWLSFDRRRVRREPAVPYLLPEHQGRAAASRPNSAPAGAPAGALLGPRSDAASRPAAVNGSASGPTVNRSTGEASR